MLLIDEKFIRSLVPHYGRHVVYTDGSTWYHEACSKVGLKHHLHSPLENSLMEELTNTSKKTELKCLMITIHACKMNVIYSCI
jgi:hypothetical protein